MDAKERMANVVFLDYIVRDPDTHLLREDIVCHVPHTLLFTNNCVPHPLHLGEDGANGSVFNLVAFLIDEHPPWRESRFNNIFPSMQRKHNLWSILPSVSHVFCFSFKYLLTYVHFLNNDSTYFCASLWVESGRHRFCVAIHKIYFLWNIHQHDSVVVKSLNLESESSLESPVFQSRSNPSH